MRGLQRTPWHYFLLSLGCAFVFLTSVVENLLSSTKGMIAGEYVPPPHAVTAQTTTTNMLTSEGGTDSLLTSKNMLAGEHVPRPPDVVTVETTTPEVSTSEGDTASLLWKDLRVALYMTSHQSKQHLDFLTRCWKFSVQHNPLLQHADLIYFTSSDPTPIVYELGFRSVVIKRYDQVELASTENSTFEERDNVKQQGAIQAMTDPARYGYFDEYDWVIRLNPDVLIREDSFFRQQMVKESIDAVFKDFSNYDPDDARRNEYKLHTDFYMFRPRIYNAEKVLNKTLCAPKLGKYPNAEALLFCWFRDTFEQGRWTDIPDSMRRGAGFMGRINGDASPVVHDHDIWKRCPNYLDAYKGVRPVVYE